MTTPPAKTEEDRKALADASSQVTDVAPETDGPPSETSSPQVAATRSPTDQPIASANHPEATSSAPPSSPAVSNEESTASNPSLNVASPNATQPIHPKQPASSTAAPESNANIGSDEPTGTSPDHQQNPTESRPDLGSLLDLEDNEPFHTSESEHVEEYSAPKTPNKISQSGAIVQYHQLVQRLTVDGQMEDWAWDQLERARENLGISEAAHQQIVSDLVTDEPWYFDVKIDMGSSQGFMLGERCIVVIRLDNQEDDVIESARVWYRSSASEGRQNVDIDQLSPYARRRVSLPFWPDSAGMHEIEGIIEIKPLDGNVRFMEFGPIGFRVGRRPAAELNIELDPSPVHIQRQPLTRGDPLPNPGLLGPPQWRSLETRRIRKGAAEEWMKQHPIRHPAIRTQARPPASSTKRRIAAIEAMWGDSPSVVDPGGISAWHGPPLRTIFRECLDSEGQVDRYHSLFEVLAGDERLLATTAGAVFGTHLAASWDWIKSDDYGAEVCRQIRRHGVDHVRNMLCSPTGWQGQPANFKRRDISTIMGHTHDRLEEINRNESRNPSIMAKLRQNGTIDTWQSRKQELAELCQLCSLLIDAFQNIRELDYLKRHELDEMAWSTRRDGLVLYLETAQLLKSIGFTTHATMRTAGQHREHGT